MIAQIFFNIVVLLNIFFIIFVIFFDNKKPESTLAWVLVLVFMPYVGIIIYIIFGDFFRFSIKKKERNKLIDDKMYYGIINEQINYLKEESKFEEKDKWTDLILMNSLNARSLLSFDNNIKTFFKATDKYDELFEDLKKAKESIHLSYYIIRRDYYGNELLNILVKKALQGVEVRLIYDHIGSKITSTKFFKPLIKAGGIVKKFFPSSIFFKLYINHRNHRKMVIIDGSLGYIGGMNIGKEYAGDNKKISPWSDRHLKIEGGAVKAMQTQFFLDYLFVSKEKLDFSNPLITAKYYKNFSNTGKNMVQIVASGPDYKDFNIRNMYLKMINNAKKSIIIETPYLILDESIMTSLKLAVSSGVNVKIIIPGRPDKKIIYLATMSYARELIKEKIEIYAYKGFMHSKVFMVDDEVISIGSANMDRRSFNLNFEINAVVYNKEMCLNNYEIIEKEIENSVLLNEELSNMNIFKRLLEKIARLFAPII